MDRIYFHRIRVSKLSLFVQWTDHFSAVLLGRRNLPANECCRKIRVVYVRKLDALVFINVTFILSPVRIFFCYHYNTEKTTQPFEKDLQSFLEPKMDLTSNIFTKERGKKEQNLNNTVLLFLQAKETKEKPSRKSTYLIPSSRNHRRDRFQAAKLGFSRFVV